MIREIIVEIATILFTVASLVYITFVVGYILFSWGKRQAAPETFEAFWQKLESRGASYTEEEAESLYALYQERRGRVVTWPPPDLSGGLVSHLQPGC